MIKPKKQWFGDSPYIYIEDIDPVTLENGDIFTCCEGEVIAIELDWSEGSVFHLLDMTETGKEDCILKNGAPCIFNSICKREEDKVDCIDMTEEPNFKIKRTFAFIEKSRVEKMKREGIWNKVNKNP